MGPLYWMRAASTLATPDTLPWLSPTGHVSHKRPGAPCADTVRVVPTGIAAAALSGVITGGWSGPQVAAVFVGAAQPVAVTVGGPHAELLAAAAPHADPPEPALAASKAACWVSCCGVATGSCGRYSVAEPTHAKTCCCCDGCCCGGGGGGTGVAAAGTMAPWSC